ncbi:(2Fe-2S)-binding protein [Pedomonas mirosovicensis]|uniref:(2Fe-2S)-binding protein n=1 Tax=Pedomonas mirosovicensis TaxID=2908641 RepID=UPI00216A18F7|nr:(2Fe-2S)-binding protein [Pedomonas mirosovicensis]MCH8684350.1 (2Fe-2S)-binding protein [Pedomonas mirosovicensis]
MYVCICNGLREADVRAAARTSGEQRPNAVYAHLGCRFECGQCASFARSVITEEHKVGQPTWPAE